MNEDLFVRTLARLFRTEDPAVLNGIGDDTAVLDLGLPDGWLLLAAADQVVEMSILRRRLPLMMPG